MVETTTSLEDLPDDIILDVISHLETASQISPLSATSRRLHSVIQHEGWRGFVRRGFSSLQIPPSPSTVTGHPGTAVTWSSLADRLTYLDRCWERRAFVVSNYQEIPQARRRGSFSGDRRQTVTFYPVLDARQLSPSSSFGDDELVAWGAGEDLITRRSSIGGEDRDKDWNRLSGGHFGYSPGFGDVTALSVLDRHASSPELLVGRANGDLQLINVPTNDDDDNDDHNAQGTTTSRSLISEENVSASTNGVSQSRKSPGQLAVSWTEWNPESDMVASCQHSSLTLHDLSAASGNGDQELRAAAHYDLFEDGADDELSYVRNVKFLSRDTVACCLGSSRRPLRWGKITPTGLVFHDAVENRNAMRYLSSVTEVSMDEKTTVRAIETVGKGISESLLISAWDDGTYRLMDVRTPSPFDSVYRDRWHAYDGGSSLLVYGTQRFVAGSNLSPSIRIFDFRFPKSYHHSDALPCSSDRPQPAPPFNRVEEMNSNGSNAQCDMSSGSSASSCAWHRYSRADAYRPDATLIIGNEKYDRVYSLAKASDMSDTFYCGLQGNVAEVKLRLSEDVVEQHHPQQQQQQRQHKDKTPKRPAPPGWRVNDGGQRGTAALVETGVSLCREDEWAIEEQGVPLVRRQNRRRAPIKNGTTVMDGNRLDSAYFLA